MGAWRVALLAIVLVGCTQPEGTATGELEAIPCNSPTQCNDNDPCTQDACIAGTCSHTEQQGCCTADATCVDGQVCTADHCDLGTHTCRHEPIFDCCVDDAMCNDANQCSADNCNTAINRCVHSPVPGCCTSNQDCHDNDSCTQDSCDVATGKCSNVDIAGCCKLAGDCADTDTCTADSCTQSTHTCVHSVQPGCCELDSDCNDGELCTVDQCDLATHACVNSPVTGCCTSNSDCVDASSCTADSCNQQTHQCRHTGIPGCCAFNSQCNDGNPCTSDLCNVATGVCSNTAIDNCCLSTGDCADANPCTSDTCDLTAHQCSNTSIDACCLGDAQCGDDNGCTTDHCVLDTHSCDHVPIDNCCAADTDCTDGDPCTTDTCPADSHACAHVADPSCTGPGGGIDLSGGGCACDAGRGGAPTALLLVLVVGGLLLRRRTRGIAAALLVTASATARADGFDAQLYQAATSSSGYMTQESALVLPRGELDIGGTLDFAREPLVARDPQTGEPLMNGDVVANRFGMQLTAGYGIGARVEAGVALPVVLAQNGDPAILATGRQLSTTALGDLRLFGKLQLATSEVFAVAAALDVTLPTGNASSFTGSDTASVRPRLVLGVHPGALSAAVNAGYRVQGRSEVANVVVDDEVTLGLGAAYALRPDLSLIGEGFVAIGVFGEAHATPAEALVGARVRIAGPWLGQLAIGEGLGRGYGTPAFEAIASLGYVVDLARRTPVPEKPLPPPPPPPPPDPDPDRDGILGDADACPTEPEDKDGYQDDDGCPDPDNDGDGILDAADTCPLEPEDRDTFQDEDGCPDPDNDGDGIPDPKDVCPNQPETRNGFQDDDGCPDEIPDAVKPFVGVVEGINFKAGSADLVPGASKVLDKAVAVLVEFPDLKLEIQGHTDDQPLRAHGTFKDNDELSQARADAVLSYMSAMGVAPARLVAHGFGSQQPIVDPQGLTGVKLRAARAKNRRVEFHIIVAP